MKSNHKESIWTKIKTHRYTYYCTQVPPSCTVLYKRLAIPPTLLDENKKKTRNVVFFPYCLFECLPWRFRPILTWKKDADSQTTPPLPGLKPSDLYCSGAHCCVAGTFFVDIMRVHYITQYYYYYFILLLLYCTFFFYSVYIVYIIIICTAEIRTRSAA